MRNHHLNSWRDRLAATTSNWIINHIATREYRAFLTGVTTYGLNAAARDHHDGIPAPEHWSTYIERNRP